MPDRREPNEILCTVTAEPPYMLVRAAGVLRVSTAYLLRAALLKCLADQPAAIIVGVEGLVVADEIAVMVFAAAARQAAAWPCIPVIVCGADTATNEVLLRLGVDRQVVFSPGLEQAREHAWVLPRRVHHHLPPVPASVSVARHVAVEACRRWGLFRLAGPAGLVATELAGNAVRHAGGHAAELTVSRQSRHVHVAVRDHSEQRPRLVGPAGEAEPGGRGLLIVAAFATHWGYTRVRDGKVTWASMAVG